MYNENYFVMNILESFFISFALISSVTWVYKSMVILMELCPRSSCTVLDARLFSNALVAKVCPSHGIQMNDYISTALKKEKLIPV